MYSYPHLELMGHFSVCLATVTFPLSDLRVSLYFIKLEDSLASLETVYNDRLFLQSLRSSSWKDPSAFFWSKQIVLHCLESIDLNVYLFFSFGRSFLFLICFDTASVFAIRLLPICTSTYSESSPPRCILITINKWGVTVRKNKKRVGFLHEQMSRCVGD